MLFRSDSLQDVRQRIAGTEARLVERHRDVRVMETYVDRLRAVDFQNRMEAEQLELDDVAKSLTFRTQLESRVDKKQLNFYELGSESYGGNQYPAVDVSNVWNGNAIGAKISGGMGNTYGKSVKEGVAELRTYLDIRHRKCPNEFSF